MSASPRPKLPRPRRRTRVELVILRVLQVITGIHRIHHPRYSYGLSFPFTTWCRFHAYDYVDSWGDRILTRPTTWARCSRDSYHDCTTGGG